MITEETITYIEVGILDGDVETTGLLTHYGMKSDRIRILTGVNTNELFDMTFFTITRIVIGKSSSQYDTLEQYIFKKDSEDQDTAKSVLINQLKALEKEGRTTVSGFLTKGTFTDVPEKYTKNVAALDTAAIVESQRAATVGGKAEDKTTNTTQTGNQTVYTNYNNNYHLRNKKTIIGFARQSNLPSKAALKNMKAKVKAVTEGTFEQNLPHTVEDDPAQPPSQAAYNEPVQDIYGREFYGHDGVHEY